MARDMQTISSARINDVIAETQSDLAVSPDKHGNATGGTSSPMIELTRADPLIKSPTHEHLSVPADL